MVNEFLFTALLFEASWGSGRFRAKFNNNNTKLNQDFA